MYDARNAAQETFASPLSYLSNAMDSSSMVFPSSFGAAFVGFAVASFLCGCLSVQVLFFFEAASQRTDPQSLKFLVLGFWILDVTESFFQGYLLYDGLITNYGNVMWFRRANWSLALSSLFTVIISGAAQMFYARRIYVLSGRRKVLPSIITTLAIVGIGFAIANAAKNFKNPLIALFDAYLWIPDTFIACEIVANIIIVIAICHYLVQSKTGFQQTDILIDKLLFLTVNTGILPSLMELGHLIALSAFPDSFAHVTFDFIAPKLYTNSFLAVLNARHFRKRGSSTSTRSGERSFSISSYFSKSGRKSRKSSRNTTSSFDCESGRPRPTTISSMMDSSAPPLGLASVPIPPPPPCREHHRQTVSFEVPEP